MVALVNAYQFQLARAANSAQLAGFTGLAVACVHLLKVETSPTYRELDRCLHNAAEVDELLKKHYGRTTVEPSPDLDAVESPELPELPVFQTVCEVCGEALYDDDRRNFWALCPICERREDRQPVSPTVRRARQEERHCDDKSDV